MDSVIGDHVYLRVTKKYMNKIKKNYFVWQIIFNLSLNNLEYINYLNLLKNSLICILRNLKK